MSAIHCPYVSNHVCSICTHVGGWDQRRGCWKVYKGHVLEGLTLQIHSLYKLRMWLANNAQLAREHNITATLVCCLHCAFPSLLNVIGPHAVKSKSPIKPCDTLKAAPVIRNIKQQETILTSLSWVLSFREAISRTGLGQHGICNYRLTDSRGLKIFVEDRTFLAWQFQPIFAFNLTNTRSFPEKLTCWLLMSHKKMAQNFIFFTSAPIREEKRILRVWRASSFSSTSEICELVFLW